MTHRVSLIPTLGVLALTAVSGTQQQAFDAKRAAEAMHLIGFGGMGPAPRVLNKPFEAEAVVETVRTLADGERVVHHNTTRYFRDSKGRTRREQNVQSFGSSASVAPFQLIVISDPVAQRDYIVDPAASTVRKFGSYEVGSARRDGDAAAARSLGNRKIGGLECVGTHRSLTVAPGLTATTETWFAPAIEAIVFSKTSDPRFGETTYTMSNVSLADQPLNLFEPPPGYRIEFDGKPGVMKRNQ